MVSNKQRETRTRSSGKKRYSGQRLIFLLKLLKLSRLDGSHSYCVSRQHASGNCCTNKDTPS